MALIWCKIEPTPLAHHQHFLYSSSDRSWSLPLSHNLLVVIKCSDYQIFLDRYKLSLGCFFFMRSHLAWTYVNMPQLLSNHLNSRSRLGDCFFILHYTTSPGCLLFLNNHQVLSLNSRITEASQHSPSSLTMWNKSSLEGLLLEPQHKPLHTHFWLCHLLGMLVDS